MTRWEQESDVVSSRNVLLVLVGVLVATAIGIAIAWDLSKDVSGTRIADEPGRIPPDVNGMETTTFKTRAEGLEEHEREAERLDSYGWVDRKAGIVHIPIERAIDLYLERGPRDGAEAPR